MTSEQTKLAVWKKGKIIPKYDSDTWRWDSCGSVMRYNFYGDTTNEHGWEIDHIKPVADGGSDDLSNLQPLQWENNREKSDN